MANPEHLEILKQGVKAWNRWRNKYPDVPPDLSNANLKSVLLRTNFFRAFFRDEHLRGANLSHADLSNANLSHIDLSFANLSHAILIGADLDSCGFGYTILGNIDLSETKGLDHVKHFYPSVIGVDTIYKSRGLISKVFLRGCGVPEDLINYMLGLTMQPIQFYTCFISFTEADNVFSERLYNDLQMNGVRCWRWKEDAKWGKTLMRSIDEAVRVYDKLIVICSKQSLNAPAVIRETERALQKEDDLARQDREAEVLFPIRLDDYIFTEWNHHRKADVIAKHVGDFRHWNEPQQYKKAFDRLLRDLKASE